MKYKKTKTGFQTRFYLGERSNRKMVRVTRATLTLLKEAVNDIKADYNSKKRLNDSEISFGDFAKQWLPIHAKKEQLADKTIEGYSHHIENKILPHPISKKVLCEIDGRDVEKFQDFHLQSLANQTVKSIHSTCRAIFSTAMKQKMVLSNPFIEVAPPKVSADKGETIGYSKIISDSIISSVLLETGLRSSIAWNDTFKYQQSIATHNALTCLYFLGLRPQEVVGLKWSDFVGTEILVQRAVGITRVHGKKTTTPAFKGTKTGKNRKLTVGSILRGQLETYRQQSNMYFRNSRFYNDFNLMFPMPTGEIMSPKVISQRFKEVLTSVCDEHTAKKHQLYDLRHTHASMLINEGWDIVKVSKRLGHSDATTTLRFYAHLIPNSDIDNVESFELSLANSLSVT